MAYSSYNRGFNLDNYLPPHTPVNSPAPPSGFGHQEHRPTPMQDYLDYRVVFDRENGSTIASRAPPMEDGSESDDEEIIFKRTKNSNVPPVSSSGAGHFKHLEINNEATVLTDSAKKLQTTANASSGSVVGRSGIPRRLPSNTPAKRANCTNRTIDITARSQSQYSSAKDGSGDHEPSYHTWIQNWDMYLDIAKESIRQDERVLDSCVAHKLKMRPKRRSSTTSTQKVEQRGAGGDPQSSCTILNQQGGLTPTPVLRRLPRAHISKSSDHVPTEIQDDDDLEEPRLVQSSRERLPQTMPKKKLLKLPATDIRRARNVRIYKGSYLESITSPSPQDRILFPPDLKPADIPKQALTQGVMYLSEKSDRNWEKIVEGFRLIMRLIRFHAAYLRSDLHSIIVSIIEHVTSLRSQVTRAACQCFKEMFENLGKAMESDLDKIVEKVIDRTADTNKFIRDDATAALEAMVKSSSISSTRAIAALDTYGTKHRNAIVRSTTAKLVQSIIESMGAERVLMTDAICAKLLPMLVSFLQEGRMETRSSAKISTAILADHRSFDPQMTRHVAATPLRHVIKVIATIKDEVKKHRKC